MGSHFIVAAVLLAGTGIASVDPLKGDAAVIVTGLVGEAKTKSGKTIAAYVPLVVMRATAPPARVEEAAAKMGADLYRRAQKAGDVYPISQIADRPKE